MSVIQSVYHDGFTSGKTAKPIESNLLSLWLHFVARTVKFIVLVLNLNFLEFQVLGFRSNFLSSKWVCKNDLNRLSYISVRNFDFQSICFHKNRSLLITLVIITYYFWLDFKIALPANPWVHVVLFLKQTTDTLNIAIKSCK